MFETWEVLPYWLYFNAFVSAARAFQCYTPSLGSRIMRELYRRAHFQETSGLAAREFGMWHMLSAIVQINAGISIHDRGAYNVALWSFVLVLIHFVWERVGQRTLGGRGLLAIEILAFVSFFWMMVQHETYIYYGPEENPSINAPVLHPHEGEAYHMFPH